MTAKNPQKQGRILEGGGEFSGWPEYIPLLMRQLALVVLFNWPAGARTFFPFNTGKNLSC